MTDKIEKKRIKAELKASKKSTHTDVQISSQKPSNIVKFADGVKGIIYLIFGISLIAAIFLGEQGMVITIEDIIGSLILATAGKIILTVLALALLVYGLKQLRIVR